jgi:type IV secretory pathway TrbD component
MDFNVICHGLLYIQCLFQARTCISTSYVVVFNIFNVCSKPGHGFQRHMICHGLLYIQCLFQIRTWISTSYVMVFYIFNVCSKSGHGFQRHMSWSFIVEIHVLAWNRHWIYKRPWHMTLKYMSWLGTDIEYIKDHDIWRWNPCPGLEQTLNMICHGLLSIQCLFQIRTWISTSYVMVFYIFNVCSKSGHGFQRHMSWSFIYSMSVPSQDMDFNVICHGLLYIQCLFQARTWIPTSYVMVFYIFNVCSKPGHGFQRHMSWSFIYSMCVPSQDMDFNVICHGLLYIQCLFQARTWIPTSYVVWIYKRPRHMTLKSMSWLRTDIEYIKDHDIWRWNPCPGLEQTLNI